MEDPDGGACQRRGGGVDMLVVQTCISRLQSEEEGRQCDCHLAAWSLCPPSRGQRSGVNGIQGQVAVPFLIDSKQEDTHVVISAFPA